MCTTCAPCSGVTASATAQQVECGMIAKASLAVRADMTTGARRAASLTHEALAGGTRQPGGSSYRVRRAGAAQAYG